MRPEPLTEVVSRYLLEKFAVNSGALPPVTVRVVAVLPSSQPVNSWCTVLLPKVCDGVTIMVCELPCAHTRLAGVRYETPSTITVRPGGLDLMMVIGCVVKVPRYRVFATA